MTVALYDACVLYPNIVRDVLIWAHLDGLVLARWTDDILDEMVRALTRRGIDPDKLDRLRELMNAKVPDALVTGYEPLIDRVDLPDPDDRHVLAAAIKARADLIVTNNIRDFPAAELDAWGIAAVTADDFLLDLLTEEPDFADLVVDQVIASRPRGGSPASVVAELSRAGAVVFAEVLRARMGI